MDDISIEEEGVHEIKKLKERLKRCEEEKKQYLDGWQRAKADFVNLRREEEEAREAFIKFANKGILRDLILVADGFDRAMADRSAWEAAPENWRLGVENIRLQLLELMRSNGVEAFACDGEKFDPSRHEAAGKEKIDNKDKDGIIIRTTLQGYTMHGSVFRPAQVVIGAYE